MHATLSTLSCCSSRAAAPVAPRRVCLPAGHLCSARSTGSTCGTPKACRVPNPPTAVDLRCAAVAAALRGADGGEATGVPFAAQLRSVAQNLAAAAVAASLLLTPVTAASAETQVLRFPVSDVRGGEDRGKGEKGLGFAGLRHKQQPADAAPLSTTPCPAHRPPPPPTPTPHTSCCCCRRTQRSSRCRRRWWRRGQS